MLNSYFKLALRHLVKNRLASVINITGLSIAIACAIVVFLFLAWQYSHEAFHENKENIYLLNKIIDREDHEEIWSTTPEPLGPALLADSILIYYRKCRHCIHSESIRKTEIGATTRNKPL